MTYEEWNQILENNRNCLISDCDGGERILRTESTTKTIVGVVDLIKQAPTTEITHGCIILILSEIALSLAAIADKDEKTTELLERIDDRISDWMQSI